MELEQLRQFIAVADLGTSLAAAQRLHISQSSISRSLRRLENELGVTLFERSKNHMELNDDGRWVLARARAVVNEADNLVSGLRDRKLAERAIHVGTCAPAPLWKLLPLLAEWDPATVPVPETLSLDALERRLLEGSLDIAIWPGGNLPEGACGIPLLKESLSVALPDDHPLADNDSLSMADLDGETFLLYAGIGIWKDAHLELMPNAHYVVMDDFVTFSQIAQTSPLPRFVTQAFATDRPQEGFRIVKLTDDAATIDFHLMIRQDNQSLKPMLEWLERRLSV